MLFHQANARIIEAIAGRINIAPEKVVMNIEKFGNTSAASIPLCLSEWEGKFKQGDNIILTAFGAGFTWGALYLKCQVTSIPEIGNLTPLSVFYF